MVVVEALKCAQCGKQCDRALIDGTNYDVAACSKSAMLVCGTCSLTHYGRANCYRGTAHFLSKFCTFLNYGPEEELRLIDLQTALAVNCSNNKCNALSFGKDLYRYNIQQAFCCGMSTISSWRTRDPLETLFQKIISELNTRAIMPRTRPPRDGVRGTLPVKIIANCNTCRRELGVLSPESYCPIMLDGVVYCLSCGDKAYRYFPTSERCYCLSRLIDFIQCIPENQLGLLTYSKWLQAVDCKQHQDMLSELNAVFPAGTSTSRKLRSFFKKEHIEKLPIPKSVPIVSKPIKSAKPVDSAQAATGHMNNLTALMSKLDPRTPERLLPARITCSCGWEEELSNMFDCFTCSTYGVCALCLAKKHWGHEIKESINTLTLCVIDSQSKVTRQMLSTWTGHAKELSQQGEQSFEELCRVLGLVYKDAVNCDDPQRIQSLLTKANTSEIEVDFKNVMNSTRRLYKRIDGFCVDLLNAVEETENTNSTVKEAPHVDRK